MSINWNEEAQQQGNLDKAVGDRDSWVERGRYHVHSAVSCWSSTEESEL